MCFACVGSIVAVVAVLAYLCRSRTMFVLGAIGAGLGLVLPQGRAMISGSIEAILMTSVAHDWRTPELVDHATSCFS